MPFGSDPIRPAATKWLLLCGTLLQIHTKGLLNRTLLFWNCFWKFLCCDYQTNLLLKLISLGNRSGRWMTESLDVPYRSVWGIVVSNVGGGIVEPKSFWNRFDNLFVCNGSIGNSWITCLQYVSGIFSQLCHLGLHQKLLAELFFVICPIGISCVTLL